MSTIPAASLNKSFALAPEVLGSGSALTLDLGASTDKDVLLAVATNQPFPLRDSGIIDVSHFGLTAGGNSVKFQSPEVAVTAQFSAGVSAGIGIYDRPADALAALDLGEAPGLDLTIDGTPGARYALLRAAYKAGATVSGSHPIGTVASVTFGVKAAAAGLTAVLHRFPSGKGAGAVLTDTVRTWRLPRHVRAAENLAPGTWVVAEASGSLAVKLGAKLGYNFNFVRQAQAFGLSGDLGLKIDAAASATFGFEVSGRYLIVVGRESDDDAARHVRLRLFKLSSHGLNFGLNLKVGVTGIDTLTPDNVDDFVKAVFGVHGAQIVTALQQIEKWTSKNQDVGKLVAGLINDKALQLLETTTGIDPKQLFDTARNKLLDAVRLYQGLPSKASSELWSILEKLNAPAAADFRNALTLLASTDEHIQKQAFRDILGSTGFAASPIGRFLTALGDHGLLKLLDRLPDVRKASATALDILNGGVIAKLQSFISDKLDLNKLFDIAQATDFKKLDSFLIGRLAAFFDKNIDFSNLDEIRSAINLVVSQRKEIYKQVRTALHSRYGFELAASWERTDSSTAVVDAVFDLGESAAQALFQDIVADGALDNLFTTPLDSVRINAAVLTHELTRKTTIDISLPHFHFREQSATKALARVKPEDSGGRILLYEVTGDNTVTVANKFGSSLAITFAAAVGSAASFPDLRIHSTDGSTWSYQLVYGRERMKRKELEAITRPFLDEYMPGKLPDEASRTAFYDLLEATSDQLLHNGAAVYGDLCASFEVTLPGAALNAWALPVPDLPAAASDVSIAIQKALKRHLPLFYLNDVKKLENLSSIAPLLAWASIPPAVGFDGSRFASTSRNDVYWDHVAPELRRDAARHPSTITNLLAMLPALHARLKEAGLDHAASFYENSEAGKIVVEATRSQISDNLLENLLLFESRIVRKANDALKDIQKFLGSASTSPTKAVDRLAEFAADITTAFNKLAGETVFAGLESFRAVAQMVFAEAARALNPDLVIEPRAMLTLDILNPAPPRTFQIGDFLAGKLPQASDIAVAQRLVRDVLL